MVLNSDEVHIWIPLEKENHCDVSNYEQRFDCDGGDLEWVETDGSNVEFAYQEDFMGRLLVSHYVCTSWCPILAV